jgi:hypothetical protein
VIGDLPLDWRKSGRCDSNACVEVAMTAAGVAMRNSTNPDGPVLVFGRGEFARFRKAACANEYEVS